MHACVCMCVYEFSPAGCKFVWCEPHSFQQTKSTGLFVGGRGWRHMHACVYVCVTYNVGVGGKKGWYLLLKFSVVQALFVPTKQIDRFVWGRERVEARARLYVCV
jgi:hypothetical protein